MLACWLQASALELSELTGQAGDALTSSLSAHSLKMLGLSPRSTPTRQMKMHPNPVADDSHKPKYNQPSQGSLLRAPMQALHVNFGEKKLISKDKTPRGWSNNIMRELELNDELVKKLYNE